MSVIGRRSDDEPVAVDRGDGSGTSGPWRAAGFARGGRQQIPRPPDAVPGEEAPWAASPAAGHPMALATVIDAVAQRERAPSRLAGSAPAGAARSAVLVALSDGPEGAEVLLTRRSAHLRRHRGEVCLPGGGREPGESAEAAACREASEEVGLDAELVTVHGRLSPVGVPSSASLIVPVVGTVADRPPLRPNPLEVEQAYWVPLAVLSDPTIFREERWRRPGDPPMSYRGAVDDAGRYPVWFFELPGDTVWGATARVLTELLSLVLAP